jgi:hypothetical protein
MAGKQINGIVRRIRRGVATIDLEEGGSVKWPTSTLKIGDTVVLGYDFTTMLLRNVWTEDEFHNERFTEDDIQPDELDEENPTGLENTQLENARYCSEFSNQNFKE